MLDTLGHEHEYVLCTTLPFDRLEDYRKTLPYCVDEVRQVNDTRCDYDAFILGGGGLTWGFGWTQALVALKHVPSMIYGVGFTKKPTYNPELAGLYMNFLDLFDAITVRDKYSKDMLYADCDVKTVLTGCPSINLEPQPYICPEDAVVVCPRYEDYRGNWGQIEWLKNRLKDVDDKILFVPFAPYDMWGTKVDHSIIDNITPDLENYEIIDNHNPRQIKHLISQSKLVISGGRLHALIWAAAHGVPYEVYPEALNEEKIRAFLWMDKTYGQKLGDLERKNLEEFNKIAKD